MPIGLVKIMNNAPQSVTERYVSNLLHYGRNKEFDILAVDQSDNMVDGEHVGVHYIAHVKLGNERKFARGATMAQAVRRALEKHGVTFR